MNKTQIIAITVMTVVTAVMFAGPIALNAFAKPIVIHPCIPHPHHPCIPPCHLLGQKHCFPPCRILHSHPPHIICPRLK